MPAQRRGDCSRGSRAAIGNPAKTLDFVWPVPALYLGPIAVWLYGRSLVIAFCLAIVTLAAMAARLGDRLGAAGVVLAFVGTVLVIGDIAREAFWMPLAPEILNNPIGYTLAMIVHSFALFSAGWLLVGITIARSRLASRPAAALLCFGAFVSFTPIPGAYVLLLAGIAATARSLAKAGLPERTAIGASEVAAMT